MSRRLRQRARALVISPKHITRAELARGALEAAISGPAVLEPRPRTRGDCCDMPRPCPYVGCNHHLYLDINPQSGSIKINFPDLEPWELQESCSLDVAERGGLTLEEIGVFMNFTRERARQVEVRGLLSMRRNSLDAGVDPTGSHNPPKESELMNGYSATYVHEPTAGEPGWSWKLFHKNREVAEGWTRGRKPNAEAEVREAILARDALIAAAAAQREVA